jgi:hypothetical protein
LYRLEAVAFWPIFEKDPTRTTGLKKICKDFTDTERTEKTKTETDDEGNTKTETEVEEKEDDQLRFLFLNYIFSEAD